MANWIRLNEDEELQLFHTLFTGQTNLSGKTTAIKTLAPRAVEEGFTVLVFDTKPTVREFDGYHDIPICYRPTTDALALISLLESIRRAKLSILYATLLRITEGAEDIPDIIRNAEKMEKKSKSGFIQDACHTLADLLGRLQQELADYSLSTDLELQPGAINVMPLNTLSSEAQQLVIKTAFELALKHHSRKLILVIDEAFRFLPQAYSSACKKPVQDVITQGAKTGLFVWLATQYIATTEKDAIKGMANKLLGRQDDPTEIKATIERTRESHPKLTPDDLMTLKRGEFIFVPIDGPVKKVYIPMEERLRHQVQSHQGRRQPLIVQLVSQAQPGPENEIAGKDTLSPAEGKRVGGATDTRVSSHGPGGPEEIQLEEKALVVKVAKSERVVRLTTDDLKGQVVSVLLEAGRALGQSDIIRDAAEHGWFMDSGNLSRRMSEYAKEGLLIQEGRAYRLPRFVRFDLKEIPA